MSPTDANNYLHIRLPACLYTNKALHHPCCRSPQGCIGLLTRAMLYEPSSNHGARERNGWRSKDGIFGVGSLDPRHGKDFLSVIRPLTVDTLAKCGK
jgi:hypothetical protein